MKIKFNNYYWTEYDFIVLIAIIAFLLWCAFTILTIHGVTFTHIAGVIWGMGTLGFFLLYQLPFFGNSLEAQKILDRGDKYISNEEAKVILEDRRHTKIPSHILKRFLIFFCISGGVTLYGSITNT